MEQTSPDPTKQQQSQCWIHCCYFKSREEVWSNIRHVAPINYYRNQEELIHVCSDTLIKMHLRVNNALQILLVLILLDIYGGWMILEGTLRSFFVDWGNIKTNRGSYCIQLKRNTWGKPFLLYCRTIHQIRCDCCFQHSL